MPATSRSVSASSACSASSAASAAARAGITKLVEQRGRNAKLFGVVRRADGGLSAQTRKT